MPRAKTVEETDHLKWCQLRGSNTEVAITVANGNQLQSLSIYSSPPRYGHSSPCPKGIDAPITLDIGTTHQVPREPMHGSESEGDSWIEVSARNVPRGVNHRHHDQSKAGGHAAMCQCSVRHLVDDDRPAANEYKSECSDGFRS